jgi:hypothetical protein
VVGLLRFFLVMDEIRDFGPMGHQQRATQRENSRRLLVIDAATRRTEVSCADRCRSLRPSTLVKGRTALLAERRFRRLTCEFVWVLSRVLLCPPLECTLQNPPFEGDARRWRIRFDSGKAGPPKARSRRRDSSSGSRSSLRSGRADDGSDRRTKSLADDDNDKRAIGVHRDSEGGRAPCALASR